MYSKSFNEKTIDEFISYFKDNSGLLLTKSDLSISEIVQLSQEFELFKNRIKEVRKLSSYLKTKINEIDFDLSFIKYDKDIIYFLRYIFIELILHKENTDYSKSYDKLTRFHEQIDHLNIAKDKIQIFD